LDDPFRIQEQKSAAATATAARDPKLTRVPLRPTSRARATSTAPIPPDFLKPRRIINDAHGIDRVVFDIARSRPA
jgi:hypothetical protein